jgi:uncharacterized membrane protein YphA (DoxX/SURF4 family)
MSVSTSLYLSEIIRFFIGFVLLTAGWNKAKTYQQFTESLVTSFHFPKVLSKLFSPVVIILECSLALILLTQLLNTQLAMKISLILFSTFTSLVIFFLIRHEVVKCNCFGEESRPTSIFDIIRNVGFIIAIIFYLIFSKPDVYFANEVSYLLGTLAFIITIISINFHDMVLILKSRGQY